MIPTIGQYPDIMHKNDEKGHETLTHKFTPEQRVARRAKSIRTASHKPQANSEGYAYRKSCRDYGCKCVKHGSTRKKD
jgi:hypothetical protein